MHVEPQQDLEEGACQSKTAQRNSGSNRGRSNCRIQWRPFCVGKDSLWVDGRIRHPWLHGRHGCFLPIGRLEAFQYRVDVMVENCREQAGITSARASKKRAAGVSQL